MGSQFFLPPAQPLKFALMQKILKSRKYIIFSILLLPMLAIFVLFFAVESLTYFSQESMGTHTNMKLMPTTPLIVLSHFEYHD